MFFGPEQRLSLFFLTRLTARQRHDVLTELGAPPETESVELHSVLWHTVLQNQGAARCAVALLECPPLPTASAPAPKDPRHLAEMVCLSLPDGWRMSYLTNNRPAEQEESTWMVQLVHDATSRVVATVGQTPQGAIRQACKAALEAGEI